jgi:SNF2 family DNA or RNA helicase
LITLRKHQQEVLPLATGKNYALFWGCGAGKTLMGLSLYQENKKLVPNLKLLVIVSPKELIESAWENDCRKLGVTNFCNFKNLKQGCPDIVLTNYEYARVDKNLKSLRILIKHNGPFMCILDESSKIKNPKTSNWQMAKTLAPLFQFRYVMSGTPAPNSEQEYWTQIAFLDENIYGRNFYDFRRRYFEFTKEYKGKIYHADPAMLRDPRMARLYMQQGYKYTLVPSVQDAFFKQMSPVVSRLETRDVVDLPGESHIERPFSLNAEEKKAYKDMQKDMVATVGDTNNVVVTDNVLGKMLKLRQVSSGFMYNRKEDGTNETVHFGNSKLNSLLDLLEDIGNNQVVIWTTFKEEANQIAKELNKLGKTYTILNADTKDKAQAISDFAENKVQYVIANPQTAAHGITWVNCQYEIFYSMDYSWERYHQALHRIMRIGQTKPCFYYYLLANGTKDKSILEVIKHKGTLNDIAKEFLK